MIRLQETMMPESLTATQLARSLADVLNRVAYRRASFVVVRGRRAIAELRPLPAGTRLADLPGILAAVPRLDAAEADAFAADIEAARAGLASFDPADPWAS